MKKLKIIFVIIYFIFFQQIIKAQNMSIINGVVYNMQDKPLNAVVIYVEGKSDYAVTDSLGKFKLELPAIFKEK